MRWAPDDSIYYSSLCCVVLLSGREGSRLEVACFVHQFYLNTLAAFKTTKEDKLGHNRASMKFAIKDNFVDPQNPAKQKLFLLRTLRYSVIKNISGRRNYIPTIIVRGTIVRRTTIRPGKILLAFFICIVDVISRRNRWKLMLH